MPFHFSFFGVGGGVISKEPLRLLSMKDPGLYPSHKLHIILIIYAPTDYVKFHIHLGIKNISHATR